MLNQRRRDAFDRNVREAGNRRLMRRPRGLGKQGSTYSGLFQRLADVPVIAVNLVACVSPTIMKSRVVAALIIGFGFIIAAE